MRRVVVVVVVAVVLAAAGATGVVAGAGGIEVVSSARPPAVTTPPPVLDRAPAPPVGPPSVPSTPGVPADPVPPVTPTVPAPPERVVLRLGARGEEVADLQRRLLSLGYWIGGGVDGMYGPTTAQAVLAFQKVAGLERDGLAGQGTRDALATAERPRARSAAGSGRVVEIDLDRQVLLVVEDGRVVEAFNTSTGARGTPTPPGRFTVERHIDGIRHAPLGDLYRPKYFNGGIAVHGSPSIPGHPASHGCARVHDRAMDHLWDSGALELGTPVWVYQLPV